LKDIELNNGVIIVNVPLKQQATKRVSITKITGLSAKKYIVPQTPNSIKLIITINILKLSLSFNIPQINLVPPLTIPNKNPIK
jgi:hypothetical protein